MRNWLKTLIAEAVTQGLRDYYTTKPNGEVVSYNITATDPIGAHRGMQRAMDAGLIRQ